MKKTISFIFGLFAVISAMAQSYANHTTGRFTALQGYIHANGTSNITVTDGIPWDSISGIPTIVEISGTPVNNQVAIWTDGNTIEGDANFTFDGDSATIQDGLVVRSSGTTGYYYFNPTSGEISTNLNPVIFNMNILPNANGTRSIGSGTRTYSAGHFEEIQHNDGDIILRPNSTNHVNIVTGGLEIGSTEVIASNGDFDINGGTIDGTVIGGTTPAAGSFTSGDFSSGSTTLILGADNVATTRTNATEKVTRIGNYHFTNAEEPSVIIFSRSNATQNIINIGGGTGSMNTATDIQFYTTANNTTTTGTLRGSISSSGAWSTNSNSLTAGATTVTTLTASGDLDFTDYGSGTNTGTAAYSLAVDASGNVIEEAVGGSYSTGTFTPSYTGSTGTPTGRWIRVGDMVTVWAEGSLSSAGAVTITNMPFQNDFAQAVMGQALCVVDAVTSSSGAGRFARMLNASTSCTIVEDADFASGGGDIPTDIDVFSINVTYYTTD